MKILFTNDPKWLKKWDDYIVTEDRASHLMLSDWNKSFESYGFEFEICLALENDKIIGGFAAVIAKAMVFKFYIVPFGPIISSDYEEKLNEIIESVYNRAKKRNCCYAQINLPFSDIDNVHLLTNSLKIPFLEKAAKGHLFKYVYSSSGLNWVDLKHLDEEKMIMSLKPSVRRNVRNSYRKELEFKVLDTQEGIENAYRLFLENATNANYTIRNWEDIKNTLFGLNEKGLLKILSVFKSNEIKGAILLVKSGNYYTYILGGSKKETPDLRTGDFLQWEAIKLSINEGLDGYNISLGGSKGVFEFKNSFNTTHYYIQDGQYHWILKPIYFKFYTIVEKKLKKHKKRIANLLSVFKK
ncbi:MAG TPA: peptidoglycan bridge formation glycyltransferase FemA/FemB family protein [Flavobacterium sp.]|jgi:lipid II:glycine glycyltransferase (peptidoglycan interpeptide bridge formation enzyme)|uniref:lipid II:glycine glycyltransferase FemX n=1 Tax=Flavobacterium sp. TaxID=239 RepID=UPI002C1BE597|nr:peptidoglycan bridge formation glycyltransferase FemA/FemB family protein [Flavobacterium sp.]HPW97495.1 peptidoglycan bridge formation glycyltransferase FemA/FemB family protein [Flavobacterium sp.]HQA73821.1 peptidoglycan bridge formation glycyltransferase FemA/FemB family protein [Flavobacterium sp.]